MNREPLKAVDAFPSLPLISGPIYFQVYTRTNSRSKEFRAAISAAIVEQAYTAHPGRQNGGIKKKTYNENK